MKKFILNLMIPLVVVSIVQVPKFSFAGDGDERQVIIEQFINELTRSEPIIKQQLESLKLEIADQRKLNRYYGAFHYGSVGVAAVASIFTLGAGLAVFISATTGEAVIIGALALYPTAMIGGSFTAMELLDIRSESPKYSDKIAFIKKIVREKNETFDNAHNRIDVELEQVLVEIPDWDFFGSNEHAYVVAQIEAMEAHKALYQVHLDLIKNTREYLSVKLLELLKKKEQPKEELTPEENR